MMVMPHRGVTSPDHDSWRERFASGVTLVGWFLLAGWIASLYVGHSSSPYGVCYSPSGRSVPCSATAHR
jgi:hypothetical protein